MYYNLYQTLLEHIYGLEMIPTPEMELTLTLLSTIGCVFLIALPFILVYRIIRLLG